MGPADNHNATFVPLLTKGICIMTIRKNAYWLISPGFNFNFYKSSCLSDVSFWKFYI